MKRFALLFVAASFSLAPSVSSGQGFPSTGAGGFAPAIQIPEAAASALPSLTGGVNAAAPAQAPQQLFGQSHGSVFGSPDQFATSGVRGYQTVIESAPTSQFPVQPTTLPTAPRSVQQSLPSVQGGSQTRQRAPQLAPQTAPQQFTEPRMQVFEVDPATQQNYSPTQSTQYSTGNEVVYVEEGPAVGYESCGCGDGCTECAGDYFGGGNAAAVRAPRPMRQTRRIVGQKSGGAVFSTSGATALLFSRNLGNNVDFATNGGDVLSSNNADHDVLPGIDAFIGRRRASGRGWEARYFGLYPADQSTQIGNNARTLLPGLSQLSTATAGTAPNVFLAGPSAASIFGLGDTHVLTRQTELNNIEFNILKSSEPRLRALSTEFLFGFRYFQFGETLTYEAVDLQGGDPMFARPESAAFLSSVENNLLGFQVGARSDYQLRDRLMLHIGGKIGAFNNQVNTRQRVDYRLNNGSVINPYIEGSGERFDVGAEEDVKSILGEVDIAVSYQLSNAARVRAGYRALGITDIAFSSDQVQDDFTDRAGLLNPNTDNELVLQGAYVGLEFAY